MRVSVAGMSDFDIKALFKSVVRQIHPDLFESYPFERTRNSESLKVSLVLTGKSREDNECEF